MSKRNKEHKVFSKDQTAASIKTISGVIKDFDTFDGEKGSRNTIKKIIIENFSLESKGAIPKTIFLFLVNTRFIIKQKLISCFLNNLAFKVKIAFMALLIIENSLYSKIIPFLSRR